MKLIILLSIAGLTLAIGLSPAAAQSNNTVTGQNALVHITTGDDNVADGDSALNSDDSGSSNTAVGCSALFHNTQTAWNTAIGFNALSNNAFSESYQNQADGAYTLWLNKNGQHNSGSGYSCLANNTNGTSNTADGDSALFQNTTGDANTAFGVAALYNNTTGNDNIAVGNIAAKNLATGSDNIAIAGPAAAQDESQTIRIGAPGTQTKTFIQGISGVTVPNGVHMVVNANGRLGTIVSSAKYKEKIEPMADASEALLALKPVTFRYKPELDPDGIPQFGLVAEEVEKVNPDLVARDADGKVYTVRYEAVNAMLLNEFLKAHREIDAQQEQLDALSTKLQKVTNQLQRVAPATNVARP